MTPTNEQIYTALITILNGAALGYPVAYPGYNFTPPSTGVWLEVSFFPNRGIDYDTANTDEVKPEGMFQVAVKGRPGAGTTAVNQAAQSVMALYPKGTRISGNVRVHRPPYDDFPAFDPADMTKIVTIPYSG